MHPHTHSIRQGTCCTKSKVKHEYRGWQANYQMYSSFCIPTSEGKQMWESCRFHSSRFNDMAQQQAALPSPGAWMDRFVNLFANCSFIWWNFFFFSFQVLEGVMQCEDCLSEKSEHHQTFRLLKIYMGSCIPYWWCFKHDCGVQRFLWRRHGVLGGGVWWENVKVTPLCSSPLSPSISRTHFILFFLFFYSACITITEV